MKITCTADLHGDFPTLSGGDLLIVAGDLTAYDTAQQHRKFAQWLDEQAYQAKVVIAGNHDKRIDKDVIEAFPACHYLHDSGMTFDGFKVWGSPWSVWFKGANPCCKAFMTSEEDLEKKYALIPEDIDILVTHTPAFGILDEIDVYKTFLLQFKKHVGSVSLRKHLMRVKPKLHICGHIHEGYGMADLTTTLSINCSYMDAEYEPVNKPIDIEI